MPMTRSFKQVDVSRMVELAPLQIMAPSARYFDFFGIDREMCHWRIIGPNMRLVHNQAWTRSEDLAKQAAARRTNGTVGNKGSTIPKAPRPSETKPVVRNSGLIIFLSSWQIFLA